MSVRGLPAGAHPRPQALSAPDDNCWTGRRQGGGGGHVGSSIQGSLEGQGPQSTREREDEAEDQRVTWASSTLPQGGPRARQTQSW